MARSRSRSRERRRRSRSRSRERRSRSRERERGTDRDRDRDRDRRRRSRERKRSRTPEKRVFKEKRESRDERRKDRRSRSGSPYGKDPVDIESVVGIEDDVAKLMGFSGFDTTKNKKVEGNNVGEVKISKPRRYRQYMNRKGGFNRPLDWIA